MHEKLKEKKLNFGNDKEKADLNIEFSKKGIYSAQDLSEVRDAGYGDDLRVLKEYSHSLPLIKRLLMPPGRYLSIKQIKKVRR